MNIIIFIVILLILILVHEFGHYMAAKRSGIRVDEFGFGYPPRAAKLFTRKGTLFTLNWLPFGGFVKIFGEDPDDENTNGPDAARSFVHKKRGVQAGVLVAGVAMNFLLAWLLFSITLFAGMPASVQDLSGSADVTNPQLSVIGVMKDSPANVAGISSGDVIKKLSAGTDTLIAPDIDNLKAFVQTHKSENISVDIDRQGTPKNISVMPKIDTVGHATIGIDIDLIGTVKFPLGRAIVEGFKRSVETGYEVLAVLGGLIHDSFFGHPDLSSISGPVGIVSSIGTIAKFGVMSLLSFVAAISVNLAVVNILPFPALDGGRLLFILIEWIKGSRINPKIANWVNLAGFSLLILLMLVITYHDILNLL